MYVSIQTVCSCHGYLLFESLHCDRCRSLIPFQLSDESLVDPIGSNNQIAIENNGKPTFSTKGLLIPNKKSQQATTGRVRFRALCPFCNSSSFTVRYYCKRERLYYHLRIHNIGEADQATYKTIAETQNMIAIDQYGIKREQATDGSTIESVDDTFSLSGTTTQLPPSIIPYNQVGGGPTAQDAQIEAEKNLYALNELEGDLFNILRSGLFYDTLIQCQDNVKLQVHRGILGGRSGWFRHLIGEYHDSNTNDDYVLQISIDDVQSEVMNEVLNYIYTNRCMISLKNAPDLLLASKRFELEKLRKQISEFLLFRLTVDNAIEMLISAHESGSEILKQACIRIINRHAEKIKRTEKWKTFKTQYVDLIPELYENRVEHPGNVPPAFLPDVFAGPPPMSESLRSLSHLYDNPVKQRLETPMNRIMPVPQPSHQQQPPPPVQHMQQTELRSMNAAAAAAAAAASVPYQHRSESSLSSVADRDSPVKRGIMVNTRRRPNQPPAALPLTRTVFPTIRPSTEIDVYRRPVNLNERSVALPTMAPRTVYAHAPSQSSTGIPASIPGSARRLAERRQSIDDRSTPPDQHMTLTRVVSVEQAD